MPAIPYPTTTTQPLPPEQQPYPPPEATPPPPDAASSPPAAAGPPPPAAAPPSDAALQPLGQPPPDTAVQPLGQAAPPPPAASAPPVDRGSALDAIGATAAQARRAPEQAKETVQGVPENLSAFTGVGRNKQYQYQPADTGVEGISHDAAVRETQRRVDALGAAAAQVREGNIGNIGNVLGAAKDVAVSYPAQNLGQILPTEGNQVRWASERLVDEIEHGDPFYSKPQADAQERALWQYYSVGPGSSYASAVRANPDIFMRAAHEGYTTPDHLVYAPGPDAMWQLFQDPRSGLARGLADIAMDPSQILLDVGSEGLKALGGGLVTRAGEQAARTGARTVGQQLTGQAIKATGQAIEGAGTMGLSLAVPAAFAGAEKAYKALPWLGKVSQGAADRRAVQGAFEAGTETLGLRQAAQEATGAPGPTLSQITTPTADRNVRRVTIPGDATHPPIDLAYHVRQVRNADGTTREELNGVYDTVLPGPNDRYRPLTPADAQTIYDAWGRLGEADRQTLRQQAYPPLTRVETAPNEPFIEQGAERFTTAAGTPVDTGRVGTGYQREVADLRETILRAGRPERIVTDFTSSWQHSLYEGSRHPLTRRLNAEHRLQTLRDVLDSLPPQYRTPQIEAHYRQMRDLIPPEPPPFGSGMRWRGPLTGQGGGLVPLSARQRDTYLPELATMPVRQLRKAIADGRHDLIVYDRKPGVNAPPGIQNAYRTYLDLMDYRVQSPAAGRTEVAALKSEIDGLRASPSAAAGERQAAIAQVLEDNNIVPQASGMTADELVIGMENWLRATRPSFPPLPGANTAPLAGLFTPGSQDERWGMHLDDTLRAQLDHVVEINGAPRTLGERLFTHNEEMLSAAEIARRVQQGVPVARADQALLRKQLQTIQTRFPIRKGMTSETLARMSPEEVHRLAAGLTATDVEIAQGVRAPSGRLLTPLEKRNVLGKLAVPLEEFLGKWRSVVLYNPFRGVQYPLMQALGNLFTAAVAAKRAIPYYLNPRQWGRSLAYLRDAETARLPDAIRIRDQVGLGRSENLGRISRDQMGSRTAFNRETSHPLTKAAGRVLAPQWVKDFADSWDQSLRHALWQSVFEPAYNRLKRDLTPMADARFRDYAARNGVPLTISRGQIDAAITDLARREGGYFSQPQLREALFEAAGGKSAPNWKTVYDAADRTARDYHSELKKIDAVAQSEVNRVAFAGGDTNLEETLNRLTVFTWWVSRATRLYATEAAGSPFQMYLWSRAIEGANRQEQTGVAPYYKFFLPFMATPAGYTVAMNPISLMGTWLLGNTADPSDPRANLTALGRFLDGDFIGSNITMNALLGGSLQAIGALGQDARTPDVLGTNRMEREIVNALNYANQHWVQFHTTKEGNPDIIPTPGFSGRMIDWLAQRISGLLPGTQRVNEYDPTASAESQITSLVAQQVVADNPELDPNDPYDADQLRHTVDQAMADHDSELYQQALSRYVDGQYAGPGAGQGSAALDVLGAITSHWVLPFQFSRQPTYRAERNQRTGRDALRKAGAPFLDTTPEASAYDKKLGGQGVQTDAARNLALIEDAAKGDVQTQKVEKLSNAIRYDTAPDLQATFTDLGLSDLAIDGYHFTAAQIASLPEEDRRALQNRWLDASGSRPIHERYYANRDAMLASDKAYADAEGLPKYAQQYPGGVDRFVDDTAQVNPNYAQFINGTVLSGGQQVSLPELRVTDHAKWVAEVTQYDQAKQVIAGVKDSRYALAVDPKYAGVVAGLDQPVGAWLLSQDQGQPDSEFTAGLRTDYAQFTKISTGFDALDQAWGRPVGTTRALFVQNTLAGALDSTDDRSFALPRAEHDWLKANGYSDYMEATSRLKQYFNWQLQQPAGADTSIDAYNQSYFSEKNKQDVPRIAAQIATGQVPPVAADGSVVPVDPLSGLVIDANGAVAPGVRSGGATIGRPTVLASEPGGRTGTQVPPGLPVTTGQMMQGSDGSTWVYVSAGGGLGGWVDVSTLAPAA